MIRSLLHTLPLLVLLTLVGCFPYWGGLDNGLFSDKPCGAPCWQNLTPGQSTSLDVDRIAAELNNKEMPGRTEWTSISGCKTIRLTDSVGNQGRAIADLNINQGKLSFVSSSPPMGPTLRQVTNHFGPPEYFESVEIMGPDGKTEVLEIYYPSRGIAFEVSVRDGKVDYVKPSMRVDTIQYFPPSEIVGYFVSRYSCNFPKPDAVQAAQNEVQQFVQPWSGFGKVQVMPTEPRQ